MADQVEIIDENKGGKITFSNEVLTTIAGAAACEIPGVAGMSGGIKDGISEILGKKNLSKGVKVTVVENTITIDIAIIVDYGVCVPDVCAAIQDSVTQAIDTMTGLSINAINISIEGLNFKKEEADN